MFICLYRSIFNVLPILSVLVATAAHAASPSDPADLQRYDDVVAEERKAVARERSNDVLASGAAAIVLGLYGYYNTAPNPVIKLLYAATQTAGVITIGQALKERNTPHLALDIDDVLRGSRDGQTIEVAELKARIGKFKRQSSEAEVRTLAYTSTILSGLYFYNGFRERGADQTLRNVYYFLGFNFAIAGSIGFYRMSYPEREIQNLSVAVFPLPTVTYQF